MVSPGTTGARHAPLLVVVSGAPGSGKTTLAQRLGAALHLPVIARDDLQEVMYDTLGVTDAASSMRVGRAAFALLALLADRLVSAGVGALVEANYHQDGLEAQVGPLLHKASVAVIHCDGDPEVIARRYLERAERGERHPAHHDTEAVARLHVQLATGTYALPSLAVPVLRVDTTTHNEYLPDLGAIIHWCRQQAERST